MTTILGRLIYGKPYNRSYYDEKNYAIIYNVQFFCKLL